MTIANAIARNAHAQRLRTALGRAVSIPNWPVACELHRGAEAHDIYLAKERLICIGARLPATTVWDEWVTDPMPWLFIPIVIDRLGPFYGHHLYRSGEWLHGYRHEDTLALLKGLCAYGGSSGIAPAFAAQYPHGAFLRADGLGLIPATPVAVPYPCRYAVTVPEGVYYGDQRLPATFYAHYRGGGNG